MQRNTVAGTMSRPCGDKSLAERSGRSRMPKKPKRRFNLRGVRIASSVTVGALAAFDVTKGAVTSPAADTYRLVSIKAAYNLNDLGAEADDGQEIGLAHSDYTAAEIEECLEAAESIDLGNKVEQERANRLVRSLGFLSGRAIADQSISLNDGQPVKTKLNWKMAIGDTLDLWIRNGSDTVYTTGATVGVIGQMWIQQ